jgi:integrase
LVATLHATGRRRETIRKSLTVLAQVLDFAGVKDNPARDRVYVRLPREEREEPTPPTAGQIEAVLPLMPRQYALAVLVLDATGMRVGELEERGLRCSDLDEPNTRWRIRRAIEKGRRGRWVSLPPDLFASIVATLPPAKTGLPTGPCSRESPRSGCEQRSRAPARRLARRRGPRTICATAVSASGTARAKLGH